MAISEAFERFQDRHVTEEYGSGVTYTTTYVVRCDDRDDGPIVARTSTVLPTLGVTTKSYTSGSKTYTLTCSKCDGRPIDGDDLTFEFAAEFTLKAPDEADIEPNPLLRKPDVSWGFVTETVVLYEDEDGVPIQSSAGQQYDPPEEEENPLPCLVYEDNVSSYDPTLAIDLTHSVNTGAVKVPVGIRGDSRNVPAGTAYCFSYTASPGYENGVYFMRRRIELHFRRPREDGKSPWDKAVLDQGTYELDDSDPPGRRIITVGGQPTNAPVTLDGAGRAQLGEVIDPETGAVIVTGAVAVYRRHRTKPRRNFNALAFRFP
jgi:hypothetical protein